MLIFRLFRLHADYVGASSRRACHCAAKLMQVPSYESGYPVDWSFKNVACVLMLTSWSMTTCLVRFTSYQIRLEVASRRNWRIGLQCGYTRILLSAAIL